MTIHNETNAKRVQYCVGYLEMIQKSAQSNRASSADVEELLRPLLLKLNEMVTVADAEPQRHLSSVKTPEWVTIREAAQTAKLKDLTYAMAVYLNRIDEHFGDCNAD